MSKNTDEYRALAAKIEKADGELKSLEKVMDGLDADTGLLLASSVPGPIGTIADVASLAKSLAAGDLGGAMWDLVGFVPFFGDAAKAIGKGGKIARHIAAIKKAIKKAKDAIAKQEKKLEKLCKGKTKKGDVDKSATSSSCPECDGVKNAEAPQVRRKISKDKLKYKPKKRGDAPIGSDGKPVELHHKDQALGNKSSRDEMTMTDHRGKGNFKKNHPNTGQKPSTVDRAESSKQHKQHWKDEWDSGRFDDLPDK